MKSASQTIEKKPTIHPAQVAGGKSKRTRVLNVVPDMLQELRIEQFPVWYFNGVDPSVSEIHNLLDILVRENCERNNCDQVLIPSIIELSLYFQCPEIQVIDAFEALRRKGYALTYETNYAKIYVKAGQKALSGNIPGMDDDGIDWRDITHDFLADVVEPFKRRLVSMFA